MSLFQDGSIELSYDRIVRDASYPKDGYWISSLMSAPGVSHTHFSSEQIEQGMSDWQASVHGVYPNPSDVMSGNQSNMCPFARSWCIEPRTFTFDAKISTFITLSTLMLSCVNKLVFGVALTDATSGNTYHESCIATAADHSMRCNISRVLSMATPAVQSSSTVLEVSPTWRLFGELDYHLLLIDSISIEIKVDYNSSEVQGCASNIFSAESASHMTCDNCSICHHDYACFDLACPDGSVFDRHNCRGLCPSDAHYSDFDKDLNDMCCAMNNTSCAGTCDGVDVLSRNTDGALHCCSNSSVVDCAGVCKGKSVNDCMGVCNGTSHRDCADVCNGPSLYDCQGYCDGESMEDRNGMCCVWPLVLDCAGECGGNSVVDFCENCGGIDFTATSDCLSNYTGFRIQSFSTNDDAFYPIFDISDEERGMSRVVAVVVINDTPYDVWVTLVTTTDDFTPDLLWGPSQDAIIINRTQSLEINVTISVLRLYYGKSLGWTSKHMSFRYGRVAIPSESIDYITSFPIYPSATGCKAFKSKQQCSTFPGCIFCVQYPSMRILQLLSSNASTDVQGPPRSSRHLFSDLVPASYVDTDVEQEQLLGVCSDGWRSDDCVASSSHPLPGACHAVIFSVLTTITLLFT